jgi:phospholipid/cholesterol/gamma-HCH transport system permease protein
VTALPARVARRVRLWPALWSLRWITASTGVGAAILRLMVRPVTWRRPVRDEFRRFMTVAGVQSVPAVLVAAVLVGFALLGQALYWLEQLGQSAGVGDIILTVLVREVGPLTVGLLAIGRSGLIILSELSRMRAEGQLRALDAQGVDPFLLLVVPRVLALAVSTFCLTVIFVVVAPAAGYLAGIGMGVVTAPLTDIVMNITRAVGGAGYAILPLKSLCIGFTVGVVCCVTALEVRAALLPTGFFRALAAAFLLNVLISMMV